MIPETDYKELEGYLTTAQANVAMGLSSEQAKGWNEHVAAKAQVGSGAHGVVALPAVGTAARSQCYWCLVELSTRGAAPRLASGALVNCARHRTIQGQASVFNLGSGAQRSARPTTLETRRQLGLARRFLKWVSEL